MKKLIPLLAALTSVALLAGCAAGQAGASSAADPSAPASSFAQNSSAPQETPGEAASQSASQAEGVVDTMVYRGEVVQMGDGSFEVAQLPGHNYGQQSIIFNLGDTTLQQGDFPLEAGAYVEVTWNGILTRSLPPQGNAETVSVLAANSEGIVLNGAILSVEQDAGDYRVAILPFEEGRRPDETRLESAAFEERNILVVPADALEGLTADELVEGVAVSAVTKGVSTLSLPPQTPVAVLLPYTDL